MKKPDGTALISLSEYPNWYLVPTTGQLVYRKDINGKSTKIRTGVIGKLNPKTGHVDGIAAARKVVDAKILELTTDKSPEQIAREQAGITTPLIGAIWEEMVKEKTIGKKDATVLNYHKAWKHGMRGFFGVAPDEPELSEDQKKYPHTIPKRPYKTVADLTDAQISNYKAWYLDTQPERLFEKTFDFLKMLLTFMRERNYISTIPKLQTLDDLDSIIKSRKRYEKAGRVYTDEEQMKLLGAWRSFLDTRLEGTDIESKTILAARSRTLTTLGLFCGLRATEITSRKITEIDFKKRLIRVWSDKNDGWREVPLIDEAVEALKYQIESNKHLKSKWLCPKPSNPEEFITHGLVEKSWYRTRDYAEISVSGPYDARFHDCRKTFATRTAERGWPVKVACDILDMSADVYMKVYVDTVSFKVKSEFMMRDFGGAK